MVALKQGSVPDVIANKLDHLLILTSGTEQYLITCTNKKYKFLLTTTLTISVIPMRAWKISSIILTEIWIKDRCWNSPPAGTYPMTTISF